MRIKYIFIRFLHFMSYKNFEQKTVSSKVNKKLFKIF